MAAISVDREISMDDTWSVIIVDEIIRGKLCSLIIVKEPSVKMIKELKFNHHARGMV